MDLLAYLLVQPEARGLAAVVGFILGLLAFTGLARVVMR